jgi:hypothetical protein
MRVQRAAIAVSVLSALACASEVPTSAIMSLRIKPLTPTMVEGIAGTVAGVVPTVQITDSKGRPLSDVSVGFVLTTGGTLEHPRVTTSSDGIASAGTWWLPIHAGMSEIQLWVGSDPGPTVFRATVKPDVPAQIFPYSAKQGYAVAGDTVKLQFQVEDKFSNMIASVETSFRVTGGAGTVNAVKAASDTHGMVSLEWMLDPDPVANALVVSVGERDLGTFSVQGLNPASIKWYVLDSLTSANTVWSAVSAGIPGARIGFASLDGCVCIGQHGYFIRTNGSDQRWSGEYHVNGSALVSENAAWEKATLTQSGIVLDDWDPWDQSYLLAWIFKPVE